MRSRPAGSPRRTRRCAAARRPSRRCPGMPRRRPPERARPPARQRRVPGQHGACDDPLPRAAVVTDRRPWCGYVGRVEIGCAALLIDVDGTLLDSSAAVERAWRVWAAEWRLDPELVLAACHGRRTTDTVAELLPASEVVG